MEKKEKKQKNESSIEKFVRDYLAKKNYPETIESINVEVHPIFSRDIL